MNQPAHLRRSFVSTAGLLLALSLTSACGNSPAEGRAAAVQRSADTVALQAKQDLRDGWEHTARDRHDLVVRRGEQQAHARGAAPGCR
jgi:hypothetical protein